MMAADFLELDLVGEALVCAMDSTIPLTWLFA